MKIRIDDTNTVDVRVIQTMVCPAGTAYYKVEYCKDGLCIHAARTGAMYGSPNVIAMLDEQHTWTETHYQDILNPDPKPTDRENYKAGSSGGRPAWWEEKSKTHRQAILDALAQIVE